MRRLISVVVLALLPLAGCRPLFRAPAVAPKQPVDDGAIARTMNLDLVSDLGKKTIAFEVHWVEGYRPTDYALDGLREAISGFAPEKTVTIEVDAQPISTSDWEASAKGPLGAEQWVGRHTLRPALLPSAVRVPIFYIPNGEKWFDSGFLGSTMWLLAERPTGELEDLLAIFITTQGIEQASVLWLAPKRWERSTLVHEFGHVLGLIGNRRHERADVPRHCTEPQCVMGGLSAKWVAYNLPRGFFTGRIPTWYCKKCMADLQAARRWAKTEESAGRQPLANPSRVGRFESSRNAILSLLRRGLDEEAQRRVDAMLAEIPYHAGFRELAFAVWTHGAYAAAEQLYRADELGVSTSAAPSPALQYRLEILCAQGRYEEALAQMGDESFYDTRIEALQALGRHDEAVAWARRNLASEHPKEATAGLELSLAQALSVAGHHDDALQVLRSAWAGRRPSLGERLSEAEILLDAGRVADAQAAFQGVLAVAAETPEPQRSSTEIRLPLARAYAHLGEAGNARASVCGSETCEPIGWRRTALARIQVILGDRAGAMESLLQARREGGLGRLNPCLDRDLMRLQGDPRFATYFPCAPSAAHDSSEVP